ncbi:hypothetical protein H0H87_002915 [Tephrocybe sp. NHM501043]|nr:hypothetical protein H0H87_002915 [Tephrocybe sp. NHM501043]
MSSSIASTSSTKASKKLGLTLDLNRDAHVSMSSSYSATLRLPSAVDSLSNTPELEPDWTTERDTTDNDDDDDAQYIYIAADSPFYRAPSTPQTSSYLSVSGFPFACDALAEEDPLFAQPSGVFDDELSSESGEHGPVVIVDTSFMEVSDVEWKVTESLDPMKLTRADKYSHTEVSLSMLPLDINR